MRLSEELARICIEKRALSPEEARTRFEDLSTREEVFRRHAARLKDLARARELREDTSLGGYAQTGAERMLPIPHSGTEAAIRLPLIAGAGVGGYGLGKMYEPFDVSDLQRVLAPAGDKGPRLSSALEDLVSGAKAKKIVNQLRRANPEVAARALRSKGLPGFFARGATEGAAQKLRTSLEKGLKGGTSRLRQEIANIAAQTAKEKGILPRLKPWRLGGGALGLLAGTALTGLPLALRALYLKGQGGEAAAAAKARMQEALGEAEESAGKREEVLQGLEQVA